MDIALLVIFLITDWSIVGIFAAVYGGKHRYREEMCIRDRISMVRFRFKYPSHSR